MWRFSAITGFFRRPGEVAQANANPARLPDSAQKTASSLVELILAHRARQKTWPSLGAGFQPNAANESTRGGFLERAKQANPLPGWLKQPRPANHQSHPPREPAFDQSPACFGSPSDCSFGSVVPIVLPSRKPARSNSHATFGQRLTTCSTIFFVEHVESV